MIKEHLCSQSRKELIGEDVSFYRQRVQVEASKAQPKSPTTPEATPITPPPRSPRVSGAGSPSASGNVQVMLLPVKVLTLHIILRM